MQWLIFLLVWFIASLWTAGNSHCIKYSSWRNFTQGVNKMHLLPCLHNWLFSVELKPACCNSKLLFFADFGHRCFPEHLIIQRRPPDYFNYSNNLKIVSKSTEHLHLRKLPKRTPVVLLNTWCFLGVALCLCLLSCHCCASVCCSCRTA